MSPEVIQNEWFQFESRFNALKSLCDQTAKELESSEEELRKIENEQVICNRSRDYMELAKQKITASPLKHCEHLLTSAVQTVFNKPYQVKYSEEAERFVLDKGEFEVDIATAEGGGLISLISFVLNIYLILKKGTRRILIYDEQFTNVSIEFYDRFIQFMMCITKELKFDILLVSHDVRLTDDLVDHVYYIKEGVSQKVK